MSVTLETGRSVKGSVLKTTTWGALIAFSATIMVAGRGGDNPWTPSGDLARPAAPVAHPGLPAAGANAKGALPLIHAQLVNVKGGSLSSLASHSGVAYISLDRPVRAAMDVSIASVKGGYAQALGLDGSGIGVAVIDSGVTNITDLSNAGVYDVVYGPNIVVGATGTSDAFGHGGNGAGIPSGSGPEATCPTT